MRHSRLAALRCSPLRAMPRVDARLSVLALRKGATALRKQLCGSHPKVAAAGLSRAYVTPDSKEFEMPVACDPAYAWRAWASPVLVTSGARWPIAANCMPTFREGASFRGSALRSRKI